MSPAANDPTEIVVDTEVPLVRITREFNAPVEKVFRAHTDPDPFAKWNGPNGLATHVDHHDCRTGGSYRYRMVGEGFEGGFRGCFHEVWPNELFVQTFTYEDMPDGVALEKVGFEDLGGGRTRLSSTSLVDTFEDRDAFIASGMETGVREGYARPDDVLKR
jgi:uncharacterized protein YndB with AHSA1/START domain